MKRIYVSFIISFYVFFLVSGCANAPNQDSKDKILEPGTSKTVLKVGAAKVDITPDFIKHDVTLAGPTGTRNATGLLDPIFVRAIVIKSRKVKIGIVSMEQLCITSEIYDTILTSVQNVGFTCVIVLATRTHNSEGQFSRNILDQRLKTGKFQAASLEKRIIAAETALRIADATAEEAQLVLESTKAELNINDETIPFCVNKIRAEESVDTTFERLMFFSKESKALICQMMYISALPIILDAENTKISGDLPGRLSKLSENEYPHSVVIVVTSTVADLLPNEKIVNIFQKKRSDVEKLNVFAKRLQNLFYTRKKLNSTIDWDKSMQILQYENIGDAVESIFDDAVVFEIKEIEVNSDTTNSQIFSLGRLIIASFPGESSALHVREFREYTKKIKFTNAWFLACCNCRTKTYPAEKWLNKMTKTLEKMTKPDN